MGAAGEPCGRPALHPALLGRRGRQEPREQPPVWPVIRGSTELDVLWRTKHSPALVLLHKFPDRRRATGLRSCHETRAMNRFLPVCQTKDRVLMFKMYNKDFYFEMCVDNASKKSFYKHRNIKMKQIRIHMTQDICSLCNSSHQSRRFNVRNIVYFLSWPTVIYIF